jgi:hypothetical protein
MHAVRDISARKKLNTRVQQMNTKYSNFWLNGRHFVFGDWNQSRQIYIDLLLDESQNDSWSKNCGVTTSLVTGNGITKDKSRSKFGEIAGRIKCTECQPGLN